MGIIANVLQSVTMMPWYIATLVKYFFSMSDAGSETTVSAGYSFLLYLLGMAALGLFFLLAMGSQFTVFACVLLGCAAFVFVDGLVTKNRK